MNFNSEIDFKLTHDLELERDRLRLIPASTNSSFKPGTCVRIEGFVEMQKYNGMLGQVKKSIEGDTYRVMLSSEKTEFAIEGKFLICCCYRPPDRNDFWDEFQNSLDEVKQDQAKNIFVLGDLNADLPTANGRKLKHMCQANNMLYLINEPTRIARNTATVLDQIITNCPNYVNSINVTPPVSTNDHCTVGARLNFKIKREKAYQRTIWNYKNADFTHFRKILLESNLEDCLDTNDIDEACSKWTDTFLRVSKQCVPNKVVTIRPADSPWYTNELRKLKKQMMRKFHKFKQTRNDSDWEKYCQARN